MDWATSRPGGPPFKVMALTAPHIHRELPRLATGFDQVVIDTPPRLAEVAKSATIAADLVVLPVQPSPLDVWALDASVELVKEAQAVKEKLRAVIVANRVIVNTVIGRDVIDTLKEYGLPVLRQLVHQRIAFAEVVAAGSTALDYPDTLAAQEIRALVKEIKQIGR